MASTWSSRSRKLVRLLERLKEESTPAPTPTHPQIWVKASSWGRQEANRERERWYERERQRENAKKQRAKKQPTEKVTAKKKKAPVKVPPKPKTNWDRILEN